MPLVAAEHPVLAGLPADWPDFLGYNRVTEPSGEVLLSFPNGDPLLVVDSEGKGRVAAFTSDILPHWGSPRFIEWDGYVPFWCQLFRWLAGQLKRRRSGSPRNRLKCVTALHYGHANGMQSGCAGSHGRIQSDGRAVEDAHHPVAGGGFGELGAEGAAGFAGVGAAVAEGAAGELGEGARELALGGELDAGALGDGVGDRDRGEERLGVGVERVGEEVFGGGDLHQAAEVHHADAVGDVLHHQEVVGDEEVGEAALVLQAAQEVDDLALDRDVERADRLVADDHLGLDGERAGDGDALALAAGELVRVAVRVGGVEADGAHQGADALLAFGARAHAVDLGALGDDLAHGHARVERGIGVLEDHLHPAGEGAAGAAGGGDRGVLEDDLAGGGRVDAHDGAAEGGLAAAGLADEAEGLAAGDGEVDAADGVEGAAADVEALAQARGSRGSGVMAPPRGEEGGAGGFRGRVVQPAGGAVAGDGGVGRRGRARGRCAWRRGSAGRRRRRRAGR